MEVYTGAVPVLIDGAIFNSYSSTVIVQVFLPAFESAPSATAGVFLGRYIDLEPAPLRAWMNFWPACLSSRHSRGGESACVPVFYVADLQVRRSSGEPSRRLPEFGVERQERIHPGIPACLNHGWHGPDRFGWQNSDQSSRAYHRLHGTHRQYRKNLCFPPRFTITIGLLSEGKGTIVATLPAFYVNLHGEVSRAEVVFKVAAINLRHFAVTEYANFNFNSFAELNGILLGAKSDGIYPWLAVRTKDSRSPRISPRSSPPRILPGPGHLHHQPVRRPETGQDPQGNQARLYQVRRGEYQRRRTRHRFHPVYGEPVKRKKQ